MITPEQIKKAQDKCFTVPTSPKWSQCMADELNKKPYDWDWKIQEIGAVALNNAKDAYVLIRQNKGAVFKETHPDAKGFVNKELTPDFTRSGKWHINQDNPLDGCPEGLSDDATVILKLSDMWGAPMVVNHIPDNIWQHTVSFVVLEGGSDV